MDAMLKHSLWKKVKRPDLRDLKPEVVAYIEWLEKNC